MTPVLNAIGLRAAGRLHDTDLKIEAGQLVGIIGRNGSGKTSLLRAIADIDGDAELLEVEGESVKELPPSRRPNLLAFLPASHEVVWPISVAHVIALGLPRPNSNRVSELVDLFDLATFQNRPVDSLSTGERSRVLLARALAPAPRLLLLDEPLSNLDPYWALRTIEILRRLVRDEGCSALVALHDLHQLEAFDRVLLVDGGRILLDGTAASVLDSAELKRSFGVERRSGRWEIRQPADQQSSL